VEGESQGEALGLAVEALATTLGSRTDHICVFLSCSRHRWKRGGRERGGGAGVGFGGSGNNARESGGGRGGAGAGAKAAGVSGLRGGKLRGCLACVMWCGLSPF
jgi:hypothetical protein